MAQLLSGDCPAMSVETSKTSDAPFKYVPVATSKVPPRCPICRVAPNWRCRRWRVQPCSGILKRGDAKGIAIINRIQRPGGWRDIEREWPYRYRRFWRFDRIDKAVRRFNAVGADAVLQRVWWYSCLLRQYERAIQPVYLRRAGRRNRYAIYQ